MTENPENKHVYSAFRVEGGKKVERRLEFIKTESSWELGVGRRSTSIIFYFSPVYNESRVLIRERLGERNVKSFIYAFTLSKLLLLNDVLES